jgi:hypothetical protein
MSVSNIYFEAMRGLDVQTDPCNNAEQYVPLNQHKFHQDSCLHFWENR